MNKRLLTLFSMTIAAMLIFAACTTASETEGTPGAEASPGARGTPGVGTPVASPSPSPGAGGMVDLLSAYRNLLEQESFRLTAQFNDVPMSIATGQDLSLPTEIVVERADQDRHVVIGPQDADPLVEIWEVDGETYIDVGFGPSAADEADSVTGELLPLLDSDTRLIEGLAARDAEYRLVGTETIDGIETVVYEATYEVDQVQQDEMLENITGATVESRIYVAQDGNYLVRANLTLQNVQATPTADATPQALEGASIMIDVSDIGEVGPIEPPV